MTADIIVVVLVAFSAYMGYKKGLVKTVSRLFCLIVSIIVAKLLHPIINGYVMKSSLADFIREKISAKAEPTFAEMPSFLQKVVDNTVNGIADSVISIVTILLIIVVTYIVAKLIVNAFNVVAKFPVISTFNRLLGLGAGFFVGVFMVYLLFTVLIIAKVPYLQVWIDDSVIAYTMYNLIF